MALKLTSIFFIVCILLGMVPKTETGVITATVLYFTCMSLCTAGAATFAGLMSAGVATPTGMIYGAAACASTCSTLAATGAILPAP